MKRMFRKRPAGFTLIELLVTMAIMAILAAVAIPSYQEYVLRTGRTEAIIALENFATAYEKFFLNNNRYPNSLGELAEYGVTATTTSGNYRLTLHGTQVRAVAVTGKRQFKDLQCRTYIYNFQNQSRTVWNSSNSTAGTEGCWGD